MVREDGHPDEEIKKMLDDNKKKDLNLIEKGVCRLICYNDDLYLLPWCFDVWKKWIQHKILFRKTLEFCNRRVSSPESLGLAKAFERWKYSHSERQMVL